MPDLNSLLLVWFEFSSLPLVPWVLNFIVHQDCLVKKWIFKIALEEESSGSVLIEILFTDCSFRGNQSRRPTVNGCGGQCSYLRTLSSKIMLTVGRSWNTLSKPLWEALLVWGRVGEMSFTGRLNVLYPFISRCLLLCHSFVLAELSV